MEVNLTDMTNKDFDFSNFERGVNLFEFVLPYSKKTIQYKLLTGYDEKQISTELKSLEKINKNSSAEVTTRLKYTIVSIDGNEDRNTIKKYVDTRLSAKDARELRKHIKENSLTSI